VTGGKFTGGVAVTDNPAPVKLGNERTVEPPRPLPPASRRVLPETRAYRLKRLQYARSLRPDELRGLHVAVDQRHAHDLALEWQHLGLSRFPLELVDCPDRRIERAVLEVVAEDVDDGHTEVSLLIPRRRYRSTWHRFLHDHTAESIAKAVADLPHANVTFVPYHLGLNDPSLLHDPSLLNDPSFRNDSSGQNDRTTRALR